MSYNIVPRLLGRSVSITQSIYFSSICKKTAHEKSCKFFFFGFCLKNWAGRSHGMI